VTSDQFLPDDVILDVSLTTTLSPYLTAVTGMDALSQAIESFWAFGATPESRIYAKEAIQTILNVFPAVVNHPTQEARQSMLRGAHLAGKAINISKTTGPHAMSYGLTKLYHIPHGHAVALTLPQFFEYNLTADDDKTTILKTALCELLGCQTPAEGRQRLEQVIASAGLEQTLSSIGAGNRNDIVRLVDSVDLQRLSNNPRPVTKEVLAHFLETLW
jgi:alcohol dehydrogenase class IV